MDTARLRILVSAHLAHPVREFLSAHYYCAVTYSVSQNDRFVTVFEMHGTDSAMFQCLHDIKGQLPPGTRIERDTVLSEVI